jgi:AcrR family transcriptional regulator
MAAVKARRTRRQEQATATRRRMVDAGYRLFSDDGYASATMEAIAAASGVAVQTVYHVFNTKALLLKEVVQVAAAGQHDPPPEPEWLGEALVSRDGRRGLALMIEHGVGSSSRVAPLIGAINAAASTDPSFADFWDASCSVRRNGTAALVAALADHGQLRAGLATQRAADILYAIGSHETLSAFLITCGWPLEDVKAWYYDLACSQLLSEAARSAVDSGTERPTRGLSFDGVVAS